MSGATATATPPAPAPAREALGSAEWDAMVTAACAGHGLTSAFQPIVDLARGTTVGYEALARFEGWAERSPEAWFAAARAIGRHAELEAAALRTALRARGALPPNCFLTVNVSPDLLTEPVVRDVWAEQGDLGGIVVELTEQAPITSYEALEGDLAALRAAGALIAVDDAGAGYAGLRHLLVLRPQIIKLDRELVRDVDLDAAKAALVEMVGTFAGRIDAWLLAEGVERAEELDVLAALGVPLAQGYLLARPGPRWPAIDRDVALRLATRGGSSRTDTVRDLVEPVLTAVSVEEAADRFAGGHVRSVVLVDAQRRPRSVRTSDLPHRHPVEPGMRVHVDTPVSEALARAVTRGPAERFRPVMCTDAAGRLLGVVRLERMIRAALA